VWDIVQSVSVLLLVLLSITSAKCYSVTAGVTSNYQCEVSQCYYWCYLELPVQSVTVLLLVLLRITSAKCRSVTAGVT